MTCYLSPARRQPFSPVRQPAREPVFDGPLGGLVVAHRDELLKRVACRDHVQEVRLLDVVVRDRPLQSGDRSTLSRMT